jgi:hypothetical protein
MGLKSAKRATRGARNLKNAAIALMDSSVEQRAGLTQQQMPGLAACAFLCWLNFYDSFISHLFRRSMLRLQWVPSVDLALT